MKFTKIRLVGAAPIDLPIFGQDALGPYVLKSSDGLSAPDIAVNIGDTVQEGGIYQGRKIANRQAVILVGLQPDYDLGQTSQDLRTELYGLLTPRFGNLVQLEVWNDATLVAKAEGQFSKFEAAIFSKDPAVQLTLDCTHPFLMSPNLLFQAPVEGISAGKTWFEVDNAGSAPSGFMMALNITTGFTGALTINDDGGPTGQKLTVTRTWAAGDVYTIDTRDGSRGVWRKPSGTSAQQLIVNDMSLDSTWLQLYGGKNKLWVNNVNFDWVAPGFGHTPAYWGV